MELQASGSKPYQTLRTNAGYSSDVSTRYGVLVNPPMKKMDIQASSDSQNFIEMEWMPLNTGILGIGGLLNSFSAESIIRDTDIAKEMQKYSNTNIIAQAGQAMLAQANQTKQAVLSLLQ